MTTTTNPTRRRLNLPLLAIAVIALGRLAFHAVFLPAYEGPDEPLHLGRIASFADSPLRLAFAGEPLNGSIVRALELRPCAAAISRVRSCPPFGTRPAAFNLLRPLPKLPDSRHDRNPENNQPPLFYLGVGLGLRAAKHVFSQAWLDSPDGRLLLARSVCVGLVILAVAGPMRAIARRRSPALAIAGLFLLMLPGSADALARCANDAPVFCWSALVLYALERRTPLLWTSLLIAAGPLIKLTALPVAAFAVVSLWRRAGIGAAALGSLAAGLVFPVQMLRGWLWGGTYELNRPIPGIHEPFPEVALGLARSLYTFVKTIFWLGGWSFFRAPTALVVFYFLLLAGLVLVSRFRPASERLLPNATAAVVAMIGIVTFILANRRFFGGWGGVGGWYVWGWAPWILIAFDDLFSVPRRAGRVLLAFTSLFAVAANVVYFRTAFRLYL